jgi:hypothetical protein
VQGLGQHGLIAKQARRPVFEVATQLLGMVQVSLTLRNYA